MTPPSFHTPQGSSQPPSSPARSATNAVDAEIELHIELTTQDLVAGGMDPLAARTEATRRFGRISHIRQDCIQIDQGNQRWLRGAAIMTTLIQDIRYATRAFRKAPTFFFTAVATLALGIGASTTIFGVVDTVVLRALPYADASRLVVVGTMSSEGNLQSVSPVAFFQWREQSDVFDVLIASRLQDMTVVGDGTPERLLGAGVSAGYFEMLGYSPIIGRGIVSGDDQPAGNRVAILSHGAWQRRWGGNPGVIGTTVTLSRQRYAIVGVMPQDFYPPEAIYHDDVEVWFPLAFVDDDLTSVNGFLQVMGRLTSGMGIERARQSLSALEDRLALERAGGDPGHVGPVGINPLHEETVGTSKSVLLTFLGAVAFLLLIACANVANLFLARATDRDREIALRIALGAGRSRIARLLLTESLVTAFIGGTVGAGLAFGGLRVFTTLAPATLPRLGEVAVDLRVLAFTGFISMFTGLAFGLAPLARHRYTTASEALKEGALFATSGRRHSTLRSVLVIGETAIALVLLTGAGLLIRSFVRLNTSDPGFDPHGVARMELYLEHYETAEERANLFQELVQRLEALPGVMAAAATDNLPMTENASARRIVVRGHVPSDDDPTSVTMNRVAGNFFGVLDIDVLQGRPFNSTDDARTSRVVVVNDAFAQHYWPDGDAIGQQFHFGREPSEDWFTIVGVVPEISQFGLGTLPGPALYLPHRVSPFVFGNVLVRATGDLAPVISAMRQTLWSIDPELPINAIGSLESEARESITDPRFFTWLLTTFAAVAVALAAVGIYGSISYSVGQRTREMGIRIALGAARHEVRGLVVRQGMTFVGVGIVFGVAGALAVARTLEGFMFGIGTTDLPTYAAVCTTIAVVALVACWLPAHRATRVDPMVVLRSE